MSRSRSACLRQEGRAETLGTLFSVNKRVADSLCDIRSRFSNAVRADMLRAAIEDLLLAVLPEGEAKFGGDHGLIAERLERLADQFLWGHLLAHKYAHHLWKNGITTYFRHLPAGHGLFHIEQQVGRLRDFRNDVFHHNPIFDQHPKRRYNRIRELLSWVCPETNWLLGELCNPDLIIQRRPRF